MKMKSGKCSQGVVASRIERSFFIENMSQTETEKKLLDSSVGEQTEIIRRENTVTIPNVTKKTRYETIIIHTDASYSHKHNIATAGIILQNNRGDTLLETWEELPGARTSLQAEAIAALRGIQKAKDYLPSHIVAITDCDQLEKRIQDRITPERQIYSRIKSELETVRDTTFKREIDEVTESAHNQAQIGLDTVKRRMGIATNKIFLD